FRSVLPGGEVVFTITGRTFEDETQLAVLNLKTGARKTIVRGGTNAYYVDPGYLVYATADTLRAVRFDPRRLEVVGDSVSLAEHVAMFGVADYSISRTGTLVYSPAGEDRGAPRSLVWVDRSGREAPINAPPRRYQSPRLSPDGTRLAVNIVASREGGIWIWDFARETLKRLTFDQAGSQLPTWTPDGRRIIFSSRRAGASNLFWQAADGTGTVERLTTTPNDEFSSSISPDGESVVIVERRPSTGIDLTLFQLGRNPLPPPLLP